MFMQVGATEGKGGRERAARFGDADGCRADVGVEWQLLRLGLADNWSLVTREGGRCKDNVDCVYLLCDHAWLPMQKKNM